MSLRVGLLTSGGDCQGLNPTMRGIAKALYEEDPNTEIIGFLEGYQGLLRHEYRLMQKKEFSNILLQGGTILGTSRQPYKILDEPLDPQAKESLSRKAAMIQTYHDLHLDALAVLGGNGSLKTASALYDSGLNVVGLPKTIDNDLGITDRTFGFNSAYTIAAEYIDAIHTTAISHGRVFIIEIMGHKVGWLSLYAGLAAGADIILLPEIPYDPMAVVAALKARDAERKRFSIVVIAEGALTVEESKIKSEELEKQRAERQFRSVAYDLADAITPYMDQEIRVTVPGHYVRGGTPSPFDRILTTEFGVEAARMILEKDFGKMAACVGGQLTRVPLKDAAFKLKKVPLNHQVLLAARATGISFGEPLDCAGDDPEHSRKKEKDKDKDKGKK